jgi:hypothetical protein
MSSKGAKQVTEKLGISSENEGKHPSGAKAIVVSIGYTRGLKPPPPSELSFCEAY